MPTVLRVGPHRFFFYSSDGNESAHVHVEHDAGVAEFGSRQCGSPGAAGFGRAELRDINRLVNEHAQELPEAWNGYFG